MRNEHQHIETGNLLQLLVTQAKLEQLRLPVQTYNCGIDAKSIGNSALP